MEYFAINPAVYGITISSTPQAHKSDETSNRRLGDKVSGNGSRNQASTQQLSASSTTLEAAPTPRESTPRSVEGLQDKRGTPKLSSPSTTAPEPSFTGAPSSSAHEQNNANQPENTNARTQQKEERQKRKRKEYISREVGHEVDSDGEREYWRAVHDRHVAERDRRAALSPEARRQEDIQRSADVFRDHIKPRLIFDTSGLPHLDHYPLFSLQRAPDSRNGATCRFYDCTVRIFPGQYRISLSPGMLDPRGPDYYHVNCFEEILDFSSTHYVARFQPDRRKFTPDHGAQCILQEYISRWKLRIKPRERHEQDTQSSSGAEHAEAGSSSIQMYASELGTNAAEEHVVAPTIPAEPTALEHIPVVPNESPKETASSRSVVQSPSASKQPLDPDIWTLADTIWESVRQAQARAKASWEHNRVFNVLLHADDSDDIAKASTDQHRTWHITQYLLPDNDPDYNERHALSQALEDWDVDVEIANMDVSELNAAELERKEALGEPAIEEIKRFARDYHFQSFGW